jgi:hypothetical protein
MPSGNAKPSRQPAVRRAKYGQRNSVNMAVDLDDFNAMVAEMADDVDAAIRPAAQAGAEVMYRIVLGNVAAIGKKTGNLSSAIYQAFSEENSRKTAAGYERATYHVSWNARRAPHGHLIEHGHIQKFKAYIGKDGKWYTNKNAPLPQPKQIAARPFIRPAFHRQGEAVAAVEARFWELMR